MAPFTADLDTYARTYMAGQTPSSTRDDIRPGLRGKEYAFDSPDAATRHRLLLLVPDEKGAATVEMSAAFGLHVQGPKAASDDSRRTLDAIVSSLRLERAALYTEQRNTAFAFALGVPESWKSERSRTAGQTFLGQYRSPAFLADGKGQTAHASLTLAVQKAPGDGSLDAYYKSVRDNFGDAFPVLSHEPWNGGYADLMRTETQVSESRIKRYYRVAGGRGYSLTCEAREDVFSKMSTWCDIIASSLRVGSEVGS